MPPLPVFDSRVSRVSPTSITLHSTFLLQLLSRFCLPRLHTVPITFAIMRRFPNRLIDDQTHYATTKNITNIVSSISNWMCHVTPSNHAIIASANKIAVFCSALHEVVLDTDIPKISSIYARMLTAIETNVIDDAAIYALDDIVARCKNCAAHHRRPGITGYLAITLQAMRFLIFNRWRYMQGHFRRANAIKIIRFLPPSARSLICTGLTCVDSLLFLEMQFDMACSNNEQRHSVDVITGRSTAYVGQSSATNGQVGAPLRRWVQHFTEESIADPSTYSGHTSKHKMNCFKAEQPRDICLITLHVHPTLDEARVHETLLIRTCKPNANVHHNARTKFSPAHNKSTHTDANTCLLRRRPPRNLRTTQPETQYQAKLQSQLRRVSQNHADDKQRKSLHVIITAPYRQAYLELCKINSPQRGPYHLRDFPQLGLSYVACAKPSQATNWITSPRLMFELSRLCEELAPSAKRNTIRRRLAWKHRMLQLPPNRTIFIPCYPTCEQLVKHSMQELHKATRSSCNLSFDWWKKHVKFYKQPWPSIESRITKASAVADAQIQPLFGKSETWKSEAIAGADMVRLKLNLSAPDISQHDKFPMLQLDALQKALAVGRFRSRSRYIARIKKTWENQANTTTPINIPSELRRYAELMPVVPDGYILVGEDKDRHSAWIVNHECHIWRVWHQFNSVPDRWRQLYFSKVEILRMRQVLHMLCPYTRKTASTPKLLDDTTIPAIYCTIKSKCYETGTHTCCKHGHSCMRSIVSWYYYPYRSRARQLRFAFSSILIATTYTGSNAIGSTTGWETASLQTAMPDLQRVLNTLAHIPEYAHSCAKCGKQKPAISTIVCDAGQMFEQVSPIHALDAFDIALTILGSKQYIGVRIDSRKPLAYTFVKRRYPRDNVFEFVELRSWLALLSNQSGAKLAEYMFSQASGLPIGGLISKAGTSLYLGQKERAAKLCFSSQNRYPNATLALTATEAIASVRYVDDTITCSAIECETCLYTYICETYDPITFDKQPQRVAAYHTWLDIELRHEDYTPQFRFARREQKWLDFYDSTPSKFRSPPYIGKFDQQSWTTARGIMLGRETRIQELCLTPIEADRARCEEILLWIRAGWPMSALRRLLNTHPKFKTLRLLFSNYLLPLHRPHPDDADKWPFATRATDIINSTPMRSAWSSD